MKNIQLIEIYDDFKAADKEPTNKELKAEFERRFDSEISNAHIVNSLGSYKSRKANIALSKEIEVFGKYFLRSCGGLAKARIVLGLIKKQD